jgi:branched-subunit amino acid ABC-type transport system permease component
VKLLLDTTTWGCELGLVTLSLSLSYALVGYANFALVELTEVGAYLALALAGFLPLPVAVALASIGCGLLAVLLNTVIFKQISNAQLGAKMLVSIAVALVMRALVQLIWGTQGQFFDINPRPLTTVDGVFITRTQIAVIATAIVVLITFAVFLRHTKYGRALRSTAESPTLAEVRGISSQRTTSTAWLLAGSLAGLGGVLFGLNTFVQPSMGFSLIIPMFAAAVVGGMGSLLGAVLGAFLLSLFENLAIDVNWGSLVGAGDWLVSTQYKSAVAMVALVVTLLIRPRGIRGRAAS